MNNANNREIGEKIFEEAKRLEESALYRATILFIVADKYQFWHYFISSCAAISSFLAATAFFVNMTPHWLVALLSLIAAASNLLLLVTEIKTRALKSKSSGDRYKSLQYRFRFLAEVALSMNADLATTNLETLREELDAVNSETPQVAEKYFELAKKKIERGDYEASIDLRNKKTLQKST